MAKYICLRLAPLRSQSGVVSRARCENPAIAEKLNERTVKPYNGTGDSTANVAGSK